LALLHRGIAEGKSWARKRGITYLMIAHRLEAEASGVILLARSKPVLVALANFFGAEQPGHEYTTLVQGAPEENSFEIDAKVAPHPLQAGLMWVDSRHGKRSCTRFAVQEKYSRWTLLKCEPLTHRPHQIQAHLSYARLPIAGDRFYGGQPLLLSRLKGAYHLKPNRTERPLISSPALHSERLALPHPVTAAHLSITAPWPKDLTVAVKYLRRYAPAN
jgi:23S rRNA-/tRNA-specific pseudouridylate synthase